MNLGDTNSKYANLFAQVSDIGPSWASCFILIFFLFWTTFFALHPFKYTALCSTNGERVGAEVRGRGGGGSCCGACEGSGVCVGGGGEGWGGVSEVC